MRVIATVFLLSTLIGCGSSNDTSTGNTSTSEPKLTKISEIQFKDDYLKECIDGIATKEQWTLISEFTYVGCDYRAIESLKGLEHLYNINSLYLPGNYFSDLSPVSQLANLTEITLGDREVLVSGPAVNPPWARTTTPGTNVQDLSPLNELPKLQKVQIGLHPALYLDSFNNKNIQELDLTNSQIIGDLTPLAKFVNLTNLRLAGTYLVESEQPKEYFQITDLEFVRELRKLKTLEIQGQNVSDFSPLSELTALEELNANRNPITDLTPLKTLQALRSLKVSSEYAGIGARADDYGKLVSPFLPERRLGQLTDISPLAGLTNLESVDISFQPVVDFSSFANFESNEINVWYYGACYFDYRAIKSSIAIIDNAPLDNINLTTDAYLCGTPEYTKISSIKFEHEHLAECVSNHASKNEWKVITDVTELDCSRRGIVSLDGLSSFTAISHLNIAGNDISDLTPLAQLINLEELILGELIPWTDELESPRRTNRDGTDVSDLSPLNEIPTLKKLQIGIHDLIDLGTLSNQQRFEELNLNGSKIGGEITLLENFVNLTKLHLNATRFTSDMQNYVKVENIEFASEFLNLEYLDIRNQAISDLSPLSELIRLTELNANGNPIKSLAGLSALNALESLYVSPELNGHEEAFDQFGKLIAPELPLRSLGEITDISFIAELPKLQSVDLSFNPVISLEPLLEFKSVGVELDFFGTCYFDFNAIKDSLTTDMPEGITLNTDLDLCNEQN